MKFLKLFSLIVFIYFLASGCSRTTKTNCGDGYCQLGEDSNYCLADCNVPDSSHYQDNLLLGSGAARVARFGKHVFGGVVKAKNKISTMKSINFNSNTGKVKTVSTLIKSPVKTSGNIGNPQPFMLPSGRLLMAYRHHFGSKINRKYRLRVSFSDDKGQTWNNWKSKNAGIIDQGNEGLWEPFLYIDKYGDLRVVYAKERKQSSCKIKRKAKKQDIVMKVSKDQGKSWQNESIVASKGISRDGVPSVARLQDGSFMVVFESWGETKCGGEKSSLVIRSMQSKDGVLWEKRKDVYNPKNRGYINTPNNQLPKASWPFITKLNDGRVAVVFSTNEGRHLEKKKKKYEFRFLPSKGGASYDNFEWDYNGMRVVMPYSANKANRYPSMIQLENNSLMVFSAQPSRYKIIPFSSSHISR